MLDARIASALNKIIHNSYLKKKVSLEEQKAQKEGEESKENVGNGKPVGSVRKETIAVSGTI